MKGRTSPTLEIEQELWELGYQRVCGLDEAGRGALAGPLVAAAVILPRKTIDGLNDSKLLTANERNKLHKIICMSTHWGVGVVEVEEINRHGIQTATYLAFRRSLDGLKVKPDFLLIDHYRLPAASVGQKSVTFGDRLSQTIAAASIVAKVTRDQIMRELARTKEGRGYLLNQHFGYGTARHLELIDRLGPSIHHRRQFVGVDKRCQTAFNFSKRLKKESGGKRRKTT